MRPKRGMIKFGKKRRQRFGIPKLTSKGHIKKNLPKNKSKFTDKKRQKRKGIQKKEGRSQLEQGRSQLEEGRSQLEEGRSQLEEGRSQLEDGKSHKWEQKSTFMKPEATVDEVEEYISEDEEVYLKKRKLSLQFMAKRLNKVASQKMSEIGAHFRLGKFGAQFFAPAVNVPTDVESDNEGEDVECERSEDEEINDQRKAEKAASKALQASVSKNAGPRVGTKSPINRAAATIKVPKSDAAAGTKTPSPLAAVGTKAPTPLATVGNKAPSPFPAVGTKAPSPLAAVTTRAPTPLATVGTKAPTSPVGTKAPTSAAAAGTKAPKSLAPVGTKLSTPGTVAARAAKPVFSNIAMSGALGSKRKGAESKN